MYDFNEGFLLGGLLEQMKDAAVVSEDGIVREYNDAASRLIPMLREGERLREVAEGEIELCSVRLSALRFEVGDLAVYTFAAPVRTGLEDVSSLLENVSVAMIESLNSSFAAAELIAATAERGDLAAAGKYNAILRHAQYKMLHVAENLRELGALTGTEPMLTLSTFDLDDLCATTLETVHSLVRDKGIRMEYDSDGMNLFLYGDRARIERMLLDVLANSIESCQPGCTISLSVRKVESGYQVAVKDDGKGMPADTLERVFDRFAIPPDPMGAPRGVGLSLSVARNIALRHGGNMFVESRAGSGTTVTISLPATDSGKTVLHVEPVVYNGRSMRPVLTALSAVLGYEYYQSPYL